jgi:hypothetical protein
MFLGHIAVGLAGKRAVPSISLGTWILSVQLVDLLWPFFLLAGLEHVRIAPGITAFTPLDFYDYPISHSLLSVLGWSLGAALLYRVVRKDWRGALVVGAAVLSHWVLDFVTHGPDLPLWPGGPKVGLGLWNSIPATMVVESLFFIATLALYLRFTTARNRTGTIALWALVVFVALVYAANLVSPPPPDAKAIGWVGLATWLFVPWGAWIDRHRQPRT